VDALSTALVMQIPDIVNEIVQYIPTIDFSKTNEQVSLFETTIRYMAGMLSGYDLLKGPLSNLTNNVRATPLSYSTFTDLHDRHPMLMPSSHRQKGWLIS